MKGFLIALLILSIFLNAILALSIKGSMPADSKGVISEELDNTYPYLSKRIFIEDQNDILINFIPLRTAMRDYMKSIPDPVGIYFEYLPSGNSIGVNEQMETKLLSLIKIPVVMATYKLMEKGKIQKDEVLNIGSKDIDLKYGSLWKKGVGAKITVEEAINLALIESDNTATNALIHRVGLQEIQDVFDGLDIPRDLDNDNTLIISPKNYSSILRGLYLSSYLNKDYSNEILDILTRTIFNDKLPAGVTSDVKVAHKIGVFDLKSTSEKTFSDCGVIYVPQRPYMLCVMAITDEKKAREYIKLLSEMVFGYVVSVKGNQIQDKK